MSYKSHDQAAVYTKDGTPLYGLSGMCVCAKVWKCFRLTGNFGKCCYIIFDTDNCSSMHIYMYWYILVFHTAELYLKTQGKRDEKMEREVEQWITSVTGESFKKSGDLEESLRDGVLLCKLSIDVYFDANYAFTDNNSTMSISNCRCHSFVCLSF